MPISAVTKLYWGSFSEERTGLMVIFQDEVPLTNANETALLVTQEPLG
jgi:hypothetical protein